MTISFWGGMTVFWGGDGRIMRLGEDDAPHIRHSGLRSGIHLARDGSLVYGTTGD
jgi:hypothetical protein